MAAAAEPSDQARPSTLICAQTAQQIAQQAKRQREIILAQYFPPIRPSALDGGIVWHVPAIVFVAADDAIAGSVKETVFDKSAT